MYEVKFITLVICACLSELVLFFCLFFFVCFFLAPMQSILVDVNGAYEYGYLISDDKANVSRYVAVRSYLMAIKLCFKSFYQEHEGIGFFAC